MTLGFRNQLDRAALSVSNNIAEGFERSTTNELQSFIAIARGSSGEVRSMMAVVKDRPELNRYIGRLQRIRELAESCARQLTGWSGAIEKTAFRGPPTVAGEAARHKGSGTKGEGFPHQLSAHS